MTEGTGVEMSLDAASVGACATAAGTDAEQALGAPRLRAPFPWFGGKSRVAHLVWERFGDCPNYVEPFAGSLAVLLGRPTAARTETVNDRDCYLANFWRALAADPERLAIEADWPVNEADLHARHWWLVKQAHFRERMLSEPEFYNVRIAGWWLWGICQWIGGGWCRVDGLRDAGCGARETTPGRPSRQLLHLADAGMGVHRPNLQRPHISNAGMGIHRAGLGGDSWRPDRKRPHLMTSGKGINAGRVMDAPQPVRTYMSALAGRLRRVRVACGDWTRVMGESVTVKNGLTGVFLDPPYGSEAGRDGDLYAVDDLNVAAAVREWAIANGGNPLLRIALCGYEGEHAMPADWECVPWKARGGYGSQTADGDERTNCARERIWFSPSCLGQAQGTLF